MLVDTIGQAVKEMKDELDRLHVTNTLSREICVLIVKTAYQIGRIEGMQEMHQTTMQSLSDPKPVPTPQPEEPAPEPAPPEPQGKTLKIRVGKETERYDL